MTIEIDENMLGLWFVQWDGTDWMAGVWRTPDGPAGSCRFRYHKDDKAFDSADEKSWYDLKPDAGAGLVVTSQELIDAFSAMARFIEQENKPSQRWELIRGTSSFKQFIEELRRLPFAHMRTMPRKPP